MKKIISLLLTLVLILSLTACGGGNNEETSSNDEKKLSSNKQQEETVPETEKQDEPSDPNAPVSSVNNAVGRGSYIKHDSEDSQELLVSMGLPEYSDGEIIYTTQFEDDNSGTVYIKGTSCDECINYCQSITGVTPAYTESNSNGKYVNYTCVGNGFEFTIKFFEIEQEKSYTSNGEPKTDIWQAEIDFVPIDISSMESSVDSASTDEWEIPDYPYGELVYTKYDESGAIVSLYYNNTTVEECHEYCLDVENKGFLEVTNHDIHEDSDGLGNYIHYIAMHPSSYINYEISYEYDNMEHTVDTPDGEVNYQLVISNRGK